MRKKRVGKEARKTLLSKNAEQIFPSIARNLLCFIQMAII
jgi:hypothetical protein